MRSEGGPSIIWGGQRSRWRLHLITSGGQGISVGWRLRPEPGLCAAPQDGEPAWLVAFRARSQGRLPERRGAAGGRPMGPFAAGAECCRASARAGDQLRSCGTCGGTTPELGCGWARSCGELGLCLHLGKGCVEARATQRWAGPLEGASCHWGCVNAGLSPPWSG